MTFALDSRLENDGFFIEDWDLCRVSLKKDKTFPWLVLVPRRAEAREIFDLSPEDQVRLTHEVSRAGALLLSLTGAHKINVAALGNMVPQLHVHVIARFANDPAWPSAVWSRDWPENPYTEQEKDAFIARFRR